jgi:hypothetical protein
MYSSHEVAGGGVPVCESLPAGTSAPSDAWTTSSLVSDCIGFFKLCYSIKAGKFSDPKATDCTVHQACVDVTYDTVGEKLDLPSLPGWRGDDLACNKRFADEGGYGEMSALGMSAECDVVNDGMGGPYVFFRTSYCRPGEMCGTGGSGTFGN